MKKRILCAMVGAVGLLGFTTSSWADHTTVLTPDDLSGPGTWGLSNPYGWDWDQDAPQGSFAVGGATGFGDSSWYSNVQGSAAGGPRDYTSLRLNVQGMFGGSSVTIGDLDEISYWTNMESGTVDWQLKIYTVDTIPGGSSWYGHRFNFNTPNFGVGAGWNESSTSSNLDTNWITDGSTSDYTARSLSYLASNFGSEEILFIDIIAGYATSSPPVYSYLDGVSITVDGTTHSLDLQAAVVPLPGAAGLGLLGLGLVAVRRRFRKTA